VRGREICDLLQIAQGADGTFAEPRPSLLPEDAQHCNSLNRQHAPKSGEEAGAGWGNISDAAPRSGLTRHVTPGSILYTAWVNNMLLGRARLAIAPSG